LTSALGGFERAGTAYLSAGGIIVRRQLQPGTEVLGVWETRHIDYHTKRPQRDMAVVSFYNIGGISEFIGYVEV
jgi:hypothetical protein